MSRFLVPHAFGRDFWDAWDYPERILDQNFGLGMDLDRMVDAAFRPLYSEWPVARKSGGRKLGDAEAGFSMVKNDDSQFQVQMDVSHFKPEELSVKTVDGSLVISGKHEEKKDEHGYIKREFTRRYLLPKEVEPEKITTSLNEKGVLTLTAPKKQLEPLKGTERVIPIQSTGQQQAVTGSEQMQQ